MLDAKLRPITANFQKAFDGLEARLTVVEMSLKLLSARGVPQVASADERGVLFLIVSLVNCHWISAVVPSNPRRRCFFIEKTSTSRIAGNDSTFEKFVFVPRPPVLLSIIICTIPV